MTTITTNRLVLRPIAGNDADALVRGLNNFNVAKWTARVPFPYGLADARKFIALCAEPKDGTLRLGITIEGGELIGVISYERGQDGTAAELGYWLAQPFWARGYGKEAAHAMTAHEFDHAGHDLLAAGYRKGNDASRRILEGLGFAVTGEKMAFSAATNAGMPVVRLALTRGTWQDARGRVR